jgi:SAM-dependent methyltransferase
MNLWEASDLTLPWCLRVVATLRIAEQMATGVSHIDDLAAAVHCDSAALGSALQYLVGKGIFESPQLGAFRLNEAAQGLLDPATHLGLDLNGIGGRMAGAWITLLSYVQTGAPAYRDVFGLPFWEDLEAHPEIAASFDAMMGPAGHGEFNGDFEISGGWDDVQMVVDVGGGTGEMLAALLRLRPHLRGTLIDFPGTVERAAETFRREGVEDRVNRVGQSFFDPLPAGADLYMLRKVLNNWDDANAMALLRRCADAARPSGRVVILKGVGPDAVPHEISISSVLVGGKDRSISEFRVLAAGSGLTVVEAQQQSSGYFVVECRVL